MLTQNMNGVIAVRLDRGEEIVASLEQICEQYDIGVAKIDGLGAVRDTTVAMFDFSKKQYHETPLPQFLELTNLCGSASRKDGEVYLHLHATLADEAGNAFGGHLKKAYIGATAEIFLTILDGKINRKTDEASGLNLFDW